MKGSKKISNFIKLRIVWIIISKILKIIKLEKCNKNEKKFLKKNKKII